MGFFDFLGDVAKGMVDKAEKEASRRQSSLPPGRMRETDQIKGQDSPLPHSPGMYRHRNKETDEIEYVGQTNDIRTRQQQHAREGKLDTSQQYVQYAESRSGVSKDDLCRTEVDHIARHNPSGNTTKGGNGRR
jgi:hypothetical protein